MAKIDLQSEIFQVTFQGTNIGSGFIDVPDVMEGDIILGGSATLNGDFGFGPGNIATVYPGGQIFQTSFDWSTGEFRDLSANTYTLIVMRLTPVTP